jgi:uncharacterized protein involved in type VI secretion and phage assembly
MSETLLYAYDERITLDGALLDGPEREGLEQVRVDQAIGLPDRAALRFTDDHELTLLDGNKLVVGKQLEIKLTKQTATQERGELVTVFKGPITAVEAEFTAGFGVSIEVIALHEASKLQQVVKTVDFPDTTPADAIKKVLQTNGVTAGTITCPGAAVPFRHQVGETPWDFITRIAHDHGCEVLIRDGKVCVQQVDGTPPAGPTLRFDGGLWSFRPRVSGSAQASQVQVRTWDQASKEVLVGQANPKHAVAKLAALGKSAYQAANAGPLVVADRPVVGSTQANELAKGIAAHLGREAVEAEALCHGDAAIKPGTTVTLDGVGQRFSGEHHVSAVTHVVDGVTGYESRLQLGTPRRPLSRQIPAGAAQGLPTHQLVIGLVTNNDDPDKLNRVRLKLPVFEGIETGWARVALGAAGAQRGTVAPLAVSDEVVVGFEHGDPARPVVLGALHNGKDKPGAELTNTTKNSFAARFPRDLDVKTDGMILAESKKNASLKATEPSAAITVEAGKDISLTATGGNMTIDAGASGTFKAKASVTIEGAASLTLKGNGSVSIESNGAVQIKGTAVQIQGNSMVRVSAPQVMLG